MQSNPSRASRIMILAAITLPLAVISHSAEVPFEETHAAAELLVAGDATPAANPQGLEDLNKLQSLFQHVLSKVAQATVFIESDTATKGTGVIVGKDGIVVTVAHILGKPGSKVDVKLPDGRECQGETLGVNRKLDIGLVHLLEIQNLPAVEMGDSSKMKTGDWVVALGYTGRPNRQPKLRVGRILQTANNEIRHDATINGGDSGGPLFDLGGRLIGAHTRISVALDENFAVPINVFAKFWEPLRAGEDIDNP